VSGRWATDRCGAVDYGLASHAWVIQILPYGKEDSFGVEVRSPGLGDNLDGGSWISVLRATNLATTPPPPTTAGHGEHSKKCIQYLVDLPRQILIKTLVYLNS